LREKVASGSETDEGGGIRQGRRSLGFVVRVAGPSSGSQVLATFSRKREKGSIGTVSRRKRVAAAAAAAAAAAR
jgi:hypothetical protein